MKFTLLTLGHEDVGSFAFQIWNTSQIQDKERIIKLDYQSIANVQSEFVDLSNIPNIERRMDCT